VRKRGQPAAWTRSADRMPSTTTAVSKTRETAPAPRVVYQRRVSFNADQCDPPETTTPEPDEEVTGVDDDPSPAVELDEVEVELDVAVLAVCEVVPVPGMVEALTAPSTPTPAMADTAAAVVRRLSSRIAASRARILSCVFPFMGVSFAAGSETSLRGSWDLAENRRAGPIPASDRPMRVCLSSQSRIGQSDAGNGSLNRLRGVPPP